MLAQISIFPIGKGESLSEEVSKVVSYIQHESMRRGIKYEITSLATLIEGRDNDVWEVLRGCYDLAKQNSNRVYAAITIDEKKGRDNALYYKKNKIEQLITKP